MTAHFHWIVWLDHREAKLFSFNEDAEERHVVHAGESGRHLHHHAGSVGAGHSDVDKHYLEAIVKALEGAGEVLLVGPGQAKTEFMHYLKDHHHALAEKIVKVETVDHPSDKQLVALARKEFKAIDRMLPQRPQG